MRIATEHEAVKGNGVSLNGRRPCTRRELPPHGVYRRLSFGTRNFVVQIERRFQSSFLGPQTRLLETVFGKDNSVLQIERRFQCSLLSSQTRLTIRVSINSETIAPTRGIIVYLLDKHEETVIRKKKREVVLHHAIVKQRES